MSGTKAGGVKAGRTNIERYGKDFYKTIGAKGGRNGHTGGFASYAVGPDGMTGRERARVAGSIGGLNSKRGRANKKKQEEEK